MDATQINIQFKDNVFIQINELKQQFVTLNEKVDKIGDTSKKSMSKINRSIKSVSLASITQQFSNLSQTLNELSTPGLKFNKSMKDLEALTGLTGAKLKIIEKSAKDLAKTFGGSAADSVESYKMILSQLGPELANTPEALEKMGEAVAITSKLMGGDQLAATEVLTAAMNQYGVSLEDPIKASETMKSMMNVMAKAAAEGSSELPNIKLAIENAGIAAKAANVSFEETNAAIQVLDKAGKRGAEGGIALRNVMSTLAKGRFLPKDVQEELAAAGVNIKDLTDKNKSLSERLSTLQPVLNDSALLTKTFGQANATAAQALISQVKEVDRYTEAITDTKNAEEQAAFIMESHEEKLARVTARIEDYKISLFELTGGTIAYLQPVSEMMRQVSSLAPIYDIAKSGISLFGKVLKNNIVVTNIATIATKLFSKAWKLSPIGVVTTIVAGLASGVYALSKALRQNTPAQEAFNKVNKKTNEIAQDEISTISVLTSKIKSSKSMRKEAIDELVNKYPELLQKYKDEEDILNNIDAIQQELTDNAMERAMEQARAEVMKQNAIEITKLKMEDPSYWEETKAAWSSWGAFWGDEDAINEAVFAKRQKAIDKLEAQNQSIMASQDKALHEANDKALKTVGAFSLVAAKGMNPIAQMLSGIQDGTFGKDDPLAVVNESNSLTTENKNISDSKIEKRNISVKIDKLVENITISTTNLKDSTSDIKRQISEALIGAVRDFEVAM